MKKGSFFLLVIFPIFAFVIEHQPWFGNVYEFNFLSKYAYSYFSSVDSAKQSLGKTSNDQLVYLGLELPLSPVWSLDGDIEFTDTPRQSFSLRSLAVQARYLIYDDIIGDKISFAVGGNIRYTSSRSLKDISCPYYANCDFEGNLAVGKEFEGELIKTRLWGQGIVGKGNRGSPWIAAIAAFEGNVDQKHKWAFFLTGLHCYGRRTIIDIEHFYGYGKIREKNVEIGGRYGRRFGVWGTLSFEYKRRIYARRCPKEVNTFVLSYLLPFSF